jgi:hypothetical protein
MSIFTGSNQVVSGLVFEYDMANNKSWKGAPTTNLFDFGTSIVPVREIYITYVGQDNGWSKYSLNGTWTSGTYPYFAAHGMPSFNFIGGTLYSSQCYIKTNVPAKFDYFGTQGISYVNSPLTNAGTMISIPQLDGSVYIARYGFAYTSTTGQNGYFFTRPLQGGVTFNPATDFMWVKNCQIELGPVCTPYVPGTNNSRSNTQSLLDISGSGNIITANSITAAADGSFSFNGTSDYLSVPLTTQLLNTGFTFIIFFKQLANNNNVFCWGISAFNAGTISGALELRIRSNDAVEFSPHIGVGAPYRLGYNSGAYPFSGRNACMAITMSANGLATIYENGISIISYNYNGIGVSSAINDLIIGRGTDTYFPGSIYSMQIYNRALSQSEIQQNFNATRSRYGV